MPGQYSAIDAPRTKAPRVVASEVRLPQSDLFRDVGADDFEAQGYLFDTIPLMQLIRNSEELCVTPLLA